ncbi:uncharacterized protein LOC128965723 [Oppia nitens]|uniref:uncharacterized protein LOC128965723 n=1 Tax=Oppia nitens TaxID=1686743 RepID=UPI0023DAC9E1|nr:uncharacterized protein LOC128965723 [Oppia nitens]
MKNENNFLKIYIQRQRLKRQLEMQTSMSLEERKREEEARRHKMRMTLDQVREELIKLDQKLSDLRQQKHGLFSQLKKVLHEDVVRRRTRDQLFAQDQLFDASSLPLFAHYAPPFFASTVRSVPPPPKFGPTPPSPSQSSIRPQKRLHESVPYTPSVGKSPEMKTENTFSLPNRKFFQ